jgi:hypothetical protein
VALAQTRQREVAGASSPRPKGIVSAYYTGAKAEGNQAHALFVGQHLVIYQ